MFFVDFWGDTHVGCHQWEWSKKSCVSRIDPTRCTDSNRAAVAHNGFRKSNNHLEHCSFTVGIGIWGSERGRTIVYHLINSIQWGWCGWKRCYLWELSQGCSALWGTLSITSTRLLMAAPSTLGTTTGTWLWRNATRKSSRCSRRLPLPSDFDELLTSSMLFPHGQQNTNVFVHNSMVSCSRPIELIRARIVYSRLAILKIKNVVCFVYVI